MKTKLFWFAMMLGVILTALTSCQKDEPEIIGSEVKDEGLSQTIAETSVANPDGTVSTQLSYESWIDLNVQTRASSDRRASVILNNRLDNISKEIVVSFFQIKDGLTPRISSAYKSSEKDANMTVVDSVLVYELDRHAFELRLEIPFQVAFYDDGFTKQRMPYYRYEKIIDKGYTVTPLDSRERNGRAYACKLYSHNFEIVFNAVYYKVKAEVVLMRDLGPSNQPYLVKSEPVKRILSPLPGQEYMSILVAKQTWSNGNVENADAIVSLSYSALSRSEPFLTARGEADALFFVEARIELANDPYREELGSGPYVKLQSVYETLEIHYNFFNISIPLLRYEPYYDDGVLQSGMLAPKFSADKVKVLSTKLEFVEVIDGKSLYYMTVQLEIGVENIKFNTTYTGWVTLW